MTDSNQKLNEFRREIQGMLVRLKNLEIDIEPEGRISQGFESLSQDIDELRAEMRSEMSSLKAEMRRNYQQLSHQINGVLARQEVMLEAFTKLTDLPGEEDS